MTSFQMLDRTSACLAADEGLKLEFDKEPSCGWHIAPVLDSDRGFCWILSEGSAICTLKENERFECDVHLMCHDNNKHQANTHTPAHKLTGRLPRRNYGNILYFYLLP